MEKQRENEKRKRKDNEKVTKRRRELGKSKGCKKQEDTKIRSSKKHTKKKRE